MAAEIVAVDEVEHAEELVALGLHHLGDHVLDVREARHLEVRTEHLAKPPGGTGKRCLSVERERLGEAVVLVRPALAIASRHGVGDVGVVVIEAAAGGVAELVPLEQDLRAAVRLVPAARALHMDDRPHAGVRDVDDRGSLVEHRLRQGFAGPAKSMIPSLH